MTTSAGKYHFTPDEDFKEALLKKRELKKATGTFLLAGGLMAGHSDGELVEEEKAYLVGALDPLFEDPEKEIARLESPEEALAMMREAMEWLRVNDEERCELVYSHLCAIVAADGVLDDGEIRFMQNVANGLGIPLEEATALLHKAMQDAGLA